MSLERRLTVSVALGAALGVLCIIGVGTRQGFGGNEWFLIAMWYNRVIMGTLIGLAGGLMMVRGAANPWVRGLVLGTAVTAAFALTSELRDVPSLFAGMAYGVIIDVVATHLETDRDQVRGGACGPGEGDGVPGTGPPGAG